MTTATVPHPPTYPVHLDADTDPHASRWLWLVKWLLALPHFIVLAFLWIAFTVLSIVAFFAILFTGRYPRAIFDFNVGVLRWSWRVAYYTYGALATDRYPPFTLNEVDDYPTHLQIDYPDHLSRGLVLVKWWLLAIPHYLVVALLVGGGTWVATSNDQWQYVRYSGLVSILVLIAAVILAFTGNYPASRSQPLGAARRRLRRADDRPVPTVPPRHGPARAGPRHRHDESQRSAVGFRCGPRRGPRR